MNRFLFLGVFLFTTALTLAQSVGDFRTRSNDRNWNATNCWQRWSGTSWDNISTPPPSGTQTINVIHRLRINVNLDIDNVIFLVQSDNSIRVNSNTTLNLNSNAVVRFTGTNNDPLFKQNPTTSIINFNEGSVCEIANNLTSFTIPPGNTWHPNSILRIASTATGQITFTNPNQNFGIFEYNRTAQTGAQTYNFGNIQNRIRVLSTGSSTLSPSNNPMFIAGDIYVEGGFFNANGTTGALNHSIRDLVVNSGTFRMHNNLAANTILTVRNNFTFNGGSFAFCGQISDASSYVDVEGNIILNSNNFTNLCQGGDSGLYFTGSSISNFESTVALNADMNERFYFQQNADLEGINLFFNGSVAQATFSGVSNLDPLGPYIPIELSSSIVRNVTINNNSGVSVSVPFQLNETLFLTNGNLNNATNTVSLGANATVERTGGSVSALLGGTGTYNVVYPAHSALVTMGNEIPDSATRLQNLTISNTFGVKASKTFTVNGILNLNAPNPTANNTDGLLDMVIGYGNYATRVYGQSGYADSTSEYNSLNSYELRLGASATVTGQGDVTGKIRRNHTFTSGIPYAFGNANFRMTFNSISGSALPTQMLVTATRGDKGVHIDNQVHTAHPNQLTVARNAVRRLYQIQRTGGANNTQFVLRLPYNDNELNGNTEANLVTWDHHLPYNGKTPHEHGQTSRNTTENWVELANHGLGYLTFEGATTGTADVTKYWMLSNREAVSNFEFVGAVAPVNGTNWSINSNWVGGVAPTANDRGVIVRPNAQNPNPLTINSAVSMATFEIMAGGEVNVSNSALITITSGPIQNDGSSSWNNQGTFNAGTGTVRFTGANGTISGNANFYNLDIPSGATVVNSGSSEISISNSATVTGTWNTTQNDNTVVYNGTAQTITHPTYHSLRLGGSGNHNLPATTNINGNLTVNNASVTFTGKTLNFAGTGTQAINGSATPSEFSTVIVDKSSGTLSTDANIAVSNLTLTNGTFTVNANRSLRLTNAVSRTNGHIGGTGTVIFEGPNTIVDNLFNANTALNNITINRNTANFSVPNNFTIQGNLRLQQGTVAIGSGRINLAGGVVKDNDDTGRLDVKEATLGLSGSLSQNIAAEVFVDNEVKIIEKNDSGSANFLGATTITELLSPNQGAINSNGHLRFRSTNSKTAFVGPVGIGASVNGNVTVERFFPPRRAWRFFSVPVDGGSIRSNWMEGVNNNVIVTNANNNPTNNLNPNPGFGTHITGASGGGFDVTATNNPSLFGFTGNNWVAVTNVNNTNIEAGKAYRLLVRGDRSIPLINGATPTATTIRSHGTMVNGNVSSFGIDGTAEAFTFIGNPYQAPIDMFEFLRTADGGSLLNNTFYVWDPQAASLGAYVTISFNRDVNGNFTSLTTSNASSAAGRYLQPGQAIFVQTNSSGGASTLSLNQNHKAVGQGVNNLFRQQANEILSGQYSLSLVLFNSNEMSLGNMARDGFNIRFAEHFSNDFVEGEDAIKFANMDEDVAIQKENIQLSIERRNFPTDGEFIQLHNAKYRGTNYTYKLHFDGIPGVDAFLLDQLTQTLTPLNVGSYTYYNFTVAANNPATTDASRFRIVFNGDVLSTPSENIDLFSLYPNPASDVFYVRTNANVKTSVKAVNALGQVVFETETEPLQNVIELNAASWQAGMYMISITQNGVMQTQKLVVKH